MMHMRIFSKKYKNIIARHSSWQDSWGIDKWPSFDSSTQVYIITIPVADINEQGLWLQPLDYNNQNPGYKYVPQSDLDRKVLSGLNIVAGDESASLTWNAIVGCDYQILRDGVVIDSVSTNSYEDTGLTNGQTYIYEVCPINNYGTWGYSQVGQVIPHA